MLLSKRSSIVMLQLFLCAGISAPASEVQTIRQCYEHNAEQLHTMLVHWHRTLQVPPGTTGTFFNTDCKAAIDGVRRFYDMRLILAFGIPRPDTSLHRALSFDGRETRILMNSEYARIYPGGDRQSEFDAPDDFLALQGYPKSNFRLRFGRSEVPCNMTALLQSDDYKAQGTQVVDGTDCLVIASSSDRLFFDPSRSYALLRRELADSSDRDNRRTYDFKNFTEVSNGCWLAQMINEESWKGIARRSSSILVVDQLELSKVSDEVFSLSFEAGIVVADLRHFEGNPDGTIPFAIYTVPARPEDLDTVVAAAVERKRVTLGAKGYGTHIRWILVVTNVVIILGLLLVLVRRRLVKPV